MGEEEDTKLVWNFDDAESKLIFEMKQKFIYYRDNWDLENAYWSLLSMLSEVETLFEDNVKEELNNLFNTITSVRAETNKFENLTDIAKGSCFNLLNDFYRKLCSEIVDKDYYFRKKKEYTGL